MGERPDGHGTGPVDSDATWPDCDAALTSAYGVDYVGRVGRRACGERVLEWPFDPGGVARGGIPGHAVPRPWVL
ncbi:hypothetical protein ACFR97_07850 [Haloplanus litoreus]|uniref:Uncharacterized protein n=1 Tax=Haloplanus litoreus TaxID=767515 RepID=A0ABD6A3R5_9EURY